MKMKILGLMATALTLGVTGTALSTVNGHRLLPSC